MLNDEERRFLREGPAEIAQPSEMITDIPLRYGDQIVGTCDMLSDGSIHAHFNWSEIPTQIAELMRVGLVSDMSFAPTFIPANSKIHIDKQSTDRILRYDEVPEPPSLEQYKYIDPNRHPNPRYWGWPPMMGTAKLTDFKIDVPERKEENMADETIPPRGEGPQEHRISRAIELVYQYVKDRLEKTDMHLISFNINDVYPVWFCFTLGNWKALISTTLPDGMYYEVTYDKNNKQTYIDAYKKFENVCVPDDLDQALKDAVRRSTAITEHLA